MQAAVDMAAAQAAAATAEAVALTQLVSAKREAVDASLSRVVAGAVQDGAAREAAILGTFSR